MMAKIDWTFNKQDNMIKGTKKIDQDKSIFFHLGWNDIKIVLLMRKV